jgi:hypothetical protein
MRILFIALLPLLITSCANIASPTGGPKDTIPPTLIQTVPVNGSTNFKGKEIILTFNELVALKNPKEEIIITPATGKGTKFITKKNQIIILPEKPLDSNKTYSISFRESVVDLNESNPAENLHFAFSTGRFIDSAEVKGRIRDMLTNKPLEKFIVAVYQSDTFNITKHQPTYFTQTDKRGRFIITNLKNTHFRIYTFEDKNKNLTAESQTERIGIIPDSINFTTITDSLYIKAIKMDSRPLRLNSVRNVSNYSIIRLNKIPNSYTINTEDTIHHVSGDIKSEIIAYHKKEYPDSTLIRLTATDSINSKLDTTFYIKPTKQKPIKEFFKISPAKPIYTQRNKKFSFELTFNVPIKSFTPDSVQLYQDTIKYITLNSEQYQIDTTGRKISINTILSIPDSVLSKKLNIRVKQGALYSILADTSKFATVPLIIRYEKSLGTIILNNTHPDPQTLVQVLNDKFIISQQQRADKKNTFKDLDPSNSYIRFVTDKNNNNKWDPGNPLKNIPPEEITFYLNDKGQTQIPLRPNWEVELTWDPKRIVDKLPK